MMLTVGRAKELLSRFAPEDVVEYRLNRAEERLLTDARIVGIGVKRIALTAPYGRVVLPPRFRTIEGVKVNGVVTELANAYWGYLPGKYNAQDFNTDEVRDMGDGFAIMNDLPVGGNLVVTGTTDEVLKVWGENAQGLASVLEFAGPATHANPFVTINRVSKEQGDVAAVLTHVDADAVVTTLAILDKRDEFSYYRRYFVGSIQDCATNVVEALVKIRHIEFTSDDDIMAIHNISALENALTALQYEKEVDKTTADRFWNSAINILNREHSDSAASSELPSIRMIHVGGAPKLTSHY